MKIRIEQLTIGCLMAPEPTCCAMQQELAAQLNLILAELATLKELIMTTAAEFTAAFARVDTATTAIAARIQALLDRPLSGMTADEEAALKAQFDGLVISLEAMAVTPADPVPVPVPT